MLAVCAGIMLANLGGWDLWNPDEPRYAQVAREMAETGQYTVPHLNAAPYPDKPPLYFWLAALLSRFFGDVTAVAVRLPSVFAAIGVLALTFFLGNRLCDPLTAIIAVLILFTSEQFFTTAVSAHLDTLLTFFTTAALFLLDTAYRRLPRGSMYAFAAYTCMGLALLTKGPVGLCVPLISFLLYLVFLGQWRRVRHLHLGAGLLLAAGMLALWLVPACLLGGDAYRDNILFTQTFGRTIDSYSHKGPVYYYLIEFPVDFFPWSLFIPSACLYFWKHREKLADISLPLVWFAGTFLFFSCISGKRSLYLLPLYPAAALVMAVFWAAALRGAVARGSRLLKIPFRVLCLLLVGCGAAGALLFSFDIKIIRPIQHAADIFYTLGAALVCAGVLGLWLLRRNAGPAFLLGHVAAVTAGIFLLIVTLIFPAMNTVKSGRFFCERVLRYVGPNDPLVASFEPEMFNYFLHRYPIPVLRNADALAAQLRSSRPVYLLVKERNYTAAADDIRNNLTILERQQIGHREYLLLTNQAGASLRPVL